MTKQELKEIICPYCNDSAKQGKECMMPKSLMQCCPAEKIFNKLKEKEDVKK